MRTWGKNMTNVDFFFQVPSTYSVYDLYILWLFLSLELHKIVNLVHISMSVSYSSDHSIFRAGNTSTTVLYFLNARLSVELRKIDNVS